MPPKKAPESTEIVIKDLNDEIKYLESLATAKKGSTKLTLSTKDLEKIGSKSDYLEKVYDHWELLRRCSGALKRLGDQLEDKTAELELEKEREPDVLLQVTDVKDAINECLPDIVKAVVKETTGTKKWSDLFQKELKKEVGNSFKETVSTEFMKNQDEIVKKATAKQDQDFYERERRSRNVVISNVEESESEVTMERIQHDKDFATKVCEIADQDILKCYRLGKTEGRTKPRLLVITLKTPDTARLVHNFGVGKKVILEQQTYWINADLTLAERKANFEARQKRRERQGTPFRRRNSEVNEDSEVEDA